MTELETVLLIAVGVMWWRTYILDGIRKELMKENDAAVDAANKYATFLLRIGKGEGRVVLEDGTYTFKEINNETKPIQGS